MPKGKSNKQLLSLQEVLELAAEKGDFSRIDGRSLRPAISSREKLELEPLIRELKPKRGEDAEIARYQLTAEGRKELRRLQKKAEIIEAPKKQPPTRKTSGRKEQKAA